MKLRRLFSRLIPLAAGFGGMLSFHALGAPPASPGLTLIENGQPHAVIVLADAPTVVARKAAELVRESLHEMSGAKLEIVSEKSLGEVVLRERRIVAKRDPTPRAFILVGQSELTGRLGLSTQGLGPGGVQVETLPNAVAIFGPDEATPTDPSGTLHAATTFLEHLGFRRLWPGPLGKIVPHCTTVTVSRIQVRYTPKIQQRRIRNNIYDDRVKPGAEALGISRELFEKTRALAVTTGPNDIDWFTWNRMGGNLGIRGGHAFGDYWEKYGQQHPDWFSMKPTGSRDQTLAPHRPRLCKTNPELLDFIARQKIAELRADTSLKSVSISPNDGSGLSTWCMCEKCTRLDPPEGRPIKLHYSEQRGTEVVTVHFDHVSLTDRILTFYNTLAERVTKEYPDTLFGAQAYSHYSAPPLRTKVHPNLVMPFAPMSYVSEREHQQAVADWDGWTKAGAKLIFRPNCLNADRPTSTLVNYTHRLAADIRYLAAHGMLGTDFDALTHNWATGGLPVYALTRLLWNSELDIDALVADYCRTGFGPAAGPVLDYFRRIEALTDVAYSGELHLTKPYTPDVMGELRAHLQRAQQAATNDKEVSARVAFLRRGLEFTTIQTRLHRLLENPEANRDAARRLLDERQAMMHKIFKEDPLAVNVASFVRYEGAIGKKVGWTWAGKMPVDNGDL